MFIWNGEKFAFNIMDADVMKKFDDVSNEMWKELVEYEEKNVTDGIVGPEEIAHESEVLSRFFDDLFGNGTSEKMFASKHDLSERLKALKKLYKVRSTQMSSHNKTVNDLTEMLGVK